MTKQQKLQLLNKLLDKATAISTTSKATPTFKEWVLLVERTFRNIFGEASIELSEFKKLQFHAHHIPFSIADENAMQHIAAYRAAFETTLKFIKQYIDEIKEESENETAMEPRPKQNLPKILWLGKQKELAELFIELKNKGWINEINADLIQNYFSESKTIKQVLKPSIDKLGRANYDGVYSKAYKRKFELIGTNEIK